jgi:hypothetical protein
MVVLTASRMQATWFVVADYAYTTMVAVRCLVLGVGLSDAYCVPVEYLPRPETSSLGHELVTADHMLASAYPGAS